MSNLINIQSLHTLALNKMTDNQPELPYASPKNTIACNDVQPLKVRTPFAGQAASISCYAALALYVLGDIPYVIRGLLPLSHLLFFMQFAAFSLGIIGIVGGITGKNTATIRMATLGTLLNGLLFGISLEWYIRRIFQS